MPRRSSRTGPTSGRTSWCRRRSCPRARTTRSRTTWSPSKSRGRMLPRASPLHPKGRENTMTLNIGISESNRDSIVKILNAVLADEYVLYTKTRNYHWNVVGPQFNDLHKFFEAQYEAVDGIVDEVAERARSLGGRAWGTLAEFAKATRLREEPGEAPSAKDMLARLLADHEAIVRVLRA